MRSALHTRLVWSIRELTMAMSSLSREGEMILLLHFPSSQLSLQIQIELSSSFNYIITS